MRYAERSSPGGRAAGCPRTSEPTGSPAARTSSTSESRSPRPGLRGRARARRPPLASRRAGAASPPARSGRPARRSQRLPVLGVRLRHPVPHGAHLEDHHADRVRDDVVELSGDPAALLGHRDPCRRLSLPLCAGGALLGGLGLLGPLPEGEADEPADREQGRREEEVARLVGRVVVGDDRGAADCDAQADPRLGCPGAGCPAARRRPSRRGRDRPASTTRPPSANERAGRAHPGAGRCPERESTPAEQQEDGHADRQRLEPPAESVGTAGVVAQHRADGTLDRTDHDQEIETVLGEERPRAGHVVKLRRSGRS